MKTDESVEGLRKETSSLRFDSQQDALDYIDQAVKESNDWLKFENVGTLKSYIEGHCEIVLRINTRSEQFDLIVFRIPNRSGRTLGSAADDIESDLLVAYQDGRIKSMFVPITKVVESPQGIISSLVRIEPSNARLDVFGQRFALTERFFEECFSVPNREAPVPVARLMNASANTTSVNGMIKHSAEIGNGVSYGDRERFRDGFDQPTFVDFVSRLRICLDNYFVRTFCVEPADLGFEVIDVMLCPSDLSA
jgi:hypothetical protein